MEHGGVVRMAELPKYFYFRVYSVEHGTAIRLEDASDVDVVEVVRCLDCVKRDICRTSTTWAVATKDDWFCADGERRADNG